MSEFQPDANNLRPPADLPELPFDPSQPLPDQLRIQQMVDENQLLIETILHCQKLGMLYEYTVNQQVLHRNLVYLAKVVAETKRRKEARN